MQCRLDKQEAYSLKFINFNPRLAIVFDDCTDILAKHKNHPVIQKIFFQGRWSYITAIIACHTDKALGAELKSGSYVSIFTEEAPVRLHFGRDSMKKSKDAKNEADEACKQAFTHLAKYQKLVWIRDQKKFYKYTAHIWPKFTFGSPALLQFCNKIKADANTPINNRFTQQFV